MKTVKCKCPLCNTPLVKLPKRDCCICPNTECDYYYRLVPIDYCDLAAHGELAINTLRTIADKKYYCQDDTEIFVAPVPTTLKLIGVIEPAKKTLDKIDGKTKGKK